jgi:two-component system alkaline phosphatase synthesis response regulator PhoP
MMANQVFPPARVLVADDNPQGAELIEAYLDGTGWEVRIVPDGGEAMKQVQEWKPDVVLLDVMMPKLSGFEVCKRLKADAATRQLPVLMITALDQASDVERAVEAGTNDFLTKPINKMDLVQRVRALLLSRDQESELERTIKYVDTVTQITV